MTYEEKILDELDAAIFSGDGFHNENDLKNLKYHLERWTKALPGIEQIILASDEDE